MSRSSRTSGRSSSSVSNRDHASTGALAAPVKESPRPVRGLSLTVWFASHIMFQARLQEIHRQVTLRSLTAFLFDRFAIGGTLGLPSGKRNSRASAPFRFQTFRLASSTRGTCIVATHASLLAVPDLPPRCFAHRARSAPIPPGALGSSPPNPAQGLESGKLA